MFSRLERDVVLVFGFQSEFVNLRLASASKHRGGHWININLVIICFTLRLRGKRGLLFLEWRFDKCFWLDHFPRSKPQEAYFPIGGKSEITAVRPFILLRASGLGIGFWLRGVQPRTTMR